MPELTTNLISVSQLIKNGNRVVFSTTQCHIFHKNNKLVAVAELVKNIYKLKTKQSGEGCLLAKTDNWHRRLGHINYDDLRKLQKGIVNGINHSEDKFVKQKCIVCCEGKQRRLPFLSQGSRAKEALELVHSDVCGPMEEKFLEMITQV